MPGGDFNFWGSRGQDIFIVWININYNENDNHVVIGRDAYWSDKLLLASNFEKRDEYPSPEKNKSKNKCLFPRASYSPTLLKKSIFTIFTRRKLLKKIWDNFKEICVKFMEILSKFYSEIVGKFSENVRGSVEKIANELTCKKIFEKFWVKFGNISSRTCKIFSKILIKFNQKKMYSF